MRKIIRVLAASTSLGLVLGSVGARSAAADASDGTRLTGYTVQPASIGAAQIVSGPDGNLWSYLPVPAFPYFIDKLSPSGAVLAAYSAVGAIDGIAAGPDGDVWYAATTGQAGPAIVRITPSGQQTPFALPAGDGIPTSVAAGPDGRIWFAATGGFIGEVSQTGAVTQFPIPTQGNRSIVQLAAGSDGALWFTQDLDNASGWTGVSTVGRITVDGAVSLYPLPAGTGLAGGITLGSDGKMWLTETTNPQNASILFSVTPTGILNLYPLPFGARGSVLTSGPDGNLWIVENFDTQVGQTNHGQIAVVDTDGEQVATYQRPGLSELEGVAAGPDGNIWYTDDGSHAFVQIDLQHGAAASMTLSSVPGPTTFRQHALITAHVTGSATSGSATPATPTGWVVFSLDGSPQRAQPVVNGNATVDVPTLLQPAEHTITAQYFGDDVYLGTTAAPLTLLIEPPPFAASETLTARGSTSVTTAPFNTTGPRLLVALVSGDGPKAKQSATVAGAGLTWTLAQRANAKGGTAEIWTAPATGPLTGATVTSSLRRAGYDQFLTVLAIPNAAGVGAGVVASRASGTPTAQLTTTQDGSIVIAVGEDYTQAAAPTIPSDQLLVSQWVDATPGETFWTQQDPLPLTGGGESAGQSVTINATIPSDDTWDLAAVEVVPTMP